MVYGRKRGWRGREVLGGFTLTEVLIAAAIGAVVAWGTAAAFIAAGRMLKTQSMTAFAEASAYAQQTLERHRNRIACDDPWFDPSTCNYTGLTTWQNDPLVDAAGNPYSDSAGTESIFNNALPPGVQRRFCVTPDNCGGAAGDCLKVQVHVCWNGSTACPAVGSTCT